MSLFYTGSFFMALISLQEFTEASKTEVKLKDGQSWQDALKPGDPVIVAYIGYYVKGEVEAIGTTGKIKVAGEWQNVVPAAVYKVKGDATGTKIKDS